MGRRIRKVPGLVWLALIALLLASCEGSPLTSEPTAQPAIAVTGITAAPSPTTPPTDAPTATTAPSPTPLPPSPTATLTVTLLPTGTPIPVELPTLIPATASPNTVILGGTFEAGTSQGWLTSSPDVTNAIGTTDEHHTGAGALQINVRAGQKATFISTWIDTGRNLPEGVDSLGPRDLNNAPMEAWVKVTFASDKKVAIRAFARDTTGANNLGEMEWVSSGEWHKVELLIGSGQQDSGFNPRNVTAFGVMLDSYEYELGEGDHLYIDDLKIIDD